MTEDENLDRAMRECVAEMIHAHKNPEPLDPWTKNWIAARAQERVLNNQPCNQFESRNQRELQANYHGYDGTEEFL